MKVERTFLSEVESLSLPSRHGIPLFSSVEIKAFFAAIVSFLSINLKNKRVNGGLVEKNPNGIELTGVNMKVF